MALDQKSIEEMTAITRKWLSTVVIENNFCPFAQREFQKESIRYVVVEDKSVESLLEDLLVECNLLDNDKAIETTLVILPESFRDFEDYLDFVELANQLMVAEGCEGHYQLASFHPDYCFDGEDYNDAANYTNRSPYPMLHLLRESSLEKALSHVEDPESIPERNIELARTIGLNTMKEKLEACFDKGVGEP